MVPKPTPPGSKKQCHTATPKIHPISLDYRISGLRKAGGWRRAGGSSIEDGGAGSWFVGLVVKVEGAESLLTDKQRLAAEQDSECEISWSTAISSWKL